MDFLYVKALHIIFVIIWFSGLFYMIRLFIYYANAENKFDPAKEILQNQFQLMSKRTWYVLVWPSAILASFFAFWLLYKNPIYLEQPYMLVKLSFVLVLYVFHFKCHSIYKQIQNNKVIYTSFKLRVFNEIATILLISIVFLGVLKNAINWIWGAISILLIAVLLFMSIRIYKKRRNKNDWDTFEEKILKEDEELDV